MDSGEDSFLYSCFFYQFAEALRKIAREHPLCALNVFSRVTLKQKKLIGTMPMGTLGCLGRGGLSGRRDPASERREARTIICGNPQSASFLENFAL